jgi:hypothetical protein
MRPPMYNLRTQTNGAAMKTNHFASLLIVLMIACFAQADAPTTAPSGDASGSWKWTVATQDGTTINHSAKLTQTGEKLTGTFFDGYDNKQFDIKDGSCKDGQVMLNITRSTDNGDLKLAFSGKLDGDKIDGKLKLTFGDNDPIESDWHAQRTKDQPATQPAK